MRWHEHSGNCMVTVPSAQKSVLLIIILNRTEHLVHFIVNLMFWSLDAKTGAFLDVTKYFSGPELLSTTNCSLKQLISTSLYVGCPGGRQASVMKCNSPSPTSNSRTILSLCFRFTCSSILFTYVLPHEQFKTK